MRLFALTKTVAKYGERVVGHRAALLDQVSRRTRLFTAMAQTPTTRAAGWQLGNQDRLADYIDDVEDVDFARLRVGMPVLALTAGVGVTRASRRPGSHRWRCCRSRPGADDLADARLGIRRA